jgi:hypothetical protein
VARVSVAAATVNLTVGNLHGWARRKEAFLKTLRGSPDHRGGRDGYYELLRLDELDFPIPTHNCPTLSLLRMSSMTGCQTYCHASRPGVGWRAIAKQLGVGVGTLYRSSRVFQNSRKGFRNACSCQSRVKRQTATIRGRNSDQHAETSPPSQATH